jgi:hypothetical protein
METYVQVDSFLFIIFCLDISVILSCIDKIEFETMREPVYIEYLIRIGICYAIAILCIVFHMFTTNITFNKMMIT